MKTTPVLLAFPRVLAGRNSTIDSPASPSSPSLVAPARSVRDGEQQPLLSDIQLPGSSASYSATSTANQQPRASTDPANLIRVPKKVASVINVEPKVWFANERTWLAYLSIAVLLGSLSGTLFAGSGSEAHNGREKVVKAFGSVYGVLCVAPSLLTAGRLRLVARLCCASSAGGLTGIYSLCTLQRPPRRRLRLRPLPEAGDDDQAPVGRCVW